MSSNTTPSTQVSSRGLRYVPVKNTRNACNTSETIMTCAGQWWTLRIRLATGIDSMSWTLAELADPREQIPLHFALWYVVLYQRLRQLVLIPRECLAQGVVRDAHPGALGVDLGAVRQQRCAPN
jgi:hypothetical protein